VVALAFRPEKLVRAVEKIGGGFGKINVVKEAIPEYNSYVQPFMLLIQ
jgi:hypothetical protein